MPYDGVPKWGHYRNPEMGTRVEPVQNPFDHENELVS
jgi:hypothetical protein